MRFVSTLAILLSAALPALAQDTWELKAPAPFSSIGAAGGAVDGKLYVFALGTTAMWQYDPATNAWNPKAPLPIAVAWAGFATFGGKIYCIGGGSDTAAFLNSVLIYDPATDSWATGAPMPTPRWRAGCAVAGGKIYACGGWIEYAPDPSLVDYTDIVEEYDPVANTWTTKAPLPIILAECASGGINGKVYIASGMSGIPGASVLPGNEFSNWSRSTFEYDPATNAWTLKSPMPDSLIYGLTSPASTVLNNRLMVFGGDVVYPGPETYTTNVEYDPATDTWASRAAMPYWESYGLGLSAGGLAYCVGGVYWTGTENQAYTPTTAPPADPIPDLAVLPFSTPPSAPAGSTITIEATVVNEGAIAADGTITCTAGSTVVGSAAFPWTLWPGESYTFVFEWVTTGVPVGGYPLAVTVTTVPGEVDVTDNTASGFIWLTATPSATLQGKMAWPEHKFYSIAGDENAYQTLFGKVKNNGSAPAPVRVRFAITKDGAFYDTIYSGSTTLIGAGTTAILTANLNAAVAGVGEYSVVAQAQVSIGGVWTDVGSTKTFTFDINP
jgi:N-acetylneuraminic acid mutarotase